MKLQYQLCNGSWIGCEDRFEYFMERAASENRRLHEFDANKYPLMTRDEIIARLETGAEVRIGTDWYDKIRSGAAYEAKCAQIAATRKPVEMVKCSCGHTVPRGSVMSASLGSSCPDCYDSMSD